MGSVGSVASEDTYAEVGTLGLGGRRRWGEKKRKGETTTTPGVSLPRRRATRARAATRHRGLRGPRKTLFTGPPRELPTHASAFFTEIFKLRGTILLKTVPQIVLAAIAGLCANVAKIVYCGEGVTSNDWSALVSSVVPCPMRPSMRRWMRSIARSGERRSGSFRWWTTPLPLRRRRARKAFAA